MAKTQKSKAAIKKGKSEEPERTNLPRHATHSWNTGVAWFGVFMLLVGSFASYVSLTGEIIPGTLLTLGILCLIVGGLFAYLGFRARSLGVGVQIVNTSYDLIQRGQLSEAERLLEQAEREHKLGVVQSVALVQRGLIAMRRADVKTAIARLDEAIDVKTGFYQRAQTKLQKTNARGLRAFLRAASGDQKGAREDIEAVRASDDALPQGLSRAALAEAILTQRSGDQEALRAHLAKHRELLFDITDRRERAIVRAFQRLLESTAQSVYRKSAKRDEQAEEPPLADWVAQVVPEAAPFVEVRVARERTGELPATNASAEAQKAIAASRKAAEKNTPKPLLRRPAARLGLWVVLIVTFTGIWQLLKPENSHPSFDEGELPPPDIDPAMLPVYLIIASMAVAIGLSVWMRYKAKRDTRKLFVALAAIAKGERAVGSAELEKLRKSQLAMLAAQANLHLSHLAERQGDLAGALAQCDEGLARLSRYALRISASDILIPELISQRAFVLAAMGRHDEAEAELASLPPAFPFRSRALFRVRLVERVRQGDMKKASELAAQAGLDLALSARDELLADVVQAATNPELAGALEVRRIKREIRSITEYRRWMEVIAPAALAALEKAPEEIPQATNEDAAAAAIAAEREAEAEAEAALRASPGRAVI